MPSVSQLASIRTNINSFGGTPVHIAGNGIRKSVSTVNLGGFGDNSIDHYLKDLSELTMYKNAKICKTAVGILSEYIVKFRSESTDFISINKNGVETPESKKLNKLFRSINLEKILFTDKLKDYVYYSSELILIKVPKSGDISEATVVNLLYPFSSIVHTNVNGTKEIYVNGKLLDLVSDDYYYLPLRIGKLDLQLDPPSITIIPDNTEDLIETDSWTASSPLFGGLTLELKLFVLKDILSQLIQIQDIVSPNLLLTNVDKNTSQEKATELSEELETLINQYGDITQLISSNADITTLSQFILNNVRVYPDMLGVINGTNKLDFTRLTGKNQEIRNELDTTESQLVNAIEIPIDLYRGNSSNKFDALKQSDRLLSKVSSEMRNIDNSIIQFTKDYLTSIGKYEEDLKIECHLFDYSFIEGINSSYKYDTSTQYLKNMTSLISEIKEAIVDTKGAMDSEKLFNYLVKNAEMVYPGISDLLDKNFLKNISKMDSDDIEE